jgi:dCTP deaminase
MPSDLAAYVVGLSSWGRTGLIIATAVGVHPGFTGCLTLELANTGVVPIKLDPGAFVCQLFFHICSPVSAVSESQFAGSRRPRLAQVKLDPIARELTGRVSKNSQQSFW